MNADHFRVAGLTGTVGADDAGDVVGVALSPTIWAFVNCEEEVPILYGPRREGKTVGGIAGVIRHRERCISSRALKAAIVRDTWTNLQRTVMETLREGQNSGWWDIEFREGGTEAWINGADGTHVWFFGMDRPADANKFQSFEAGIVSIEEPAPAADLASGVPVDVFGMAVSSLSQVDVPPRLQILMNPPDEEHWTLEVADFLEEKNVKNLRVRVFWIPPGENPHLRAGYRENMRIGFEAANRQDLIARLVEGKVSTVAMGEAVTPEFSELHLFRDEQGKPGPAPMSPRWQAFRFWDFGHSCDPETEILTERGWYRLPDVPRDVRVATRSDQGALEYQWPTRYTRSRFVGNLLHVRTQNVDMLVTPDHRLRAENEHTGRLYWTTAGRAAATSGRTCLPLTARWRPRRRKSWGPLRWDAPTYAAFMGWYLSEGCVTGRRGAEPTGVTIYQGCRDQRLWRALKATGLTWRPTAKDHGRFTGWSTRHRGLAAYLAPCGRTAGEKRLPDELRALPPAALRTFLAAYIAGDGHARTRSFGPERTAFTSSRALADGLQELALKAGAHARLIPRPPCLRTITDRGGRTHVAHSRGGWVISFKRRTKLTRLTRKHFSEVPYDGYVYCVTVPNGTIYTRRHGIAHWTGNSPTCIWAQITPMGWMNVLGAIVGENMGIEELIEQEVLPWQARFGMMPPAGRLDSYQRGPRTGYAFRDIGDAAARIREQTSTRRSAAWTLERMLRTSFEAAPIDWTSRRNAVKGTLNKMVAGRPLVMLDGHECKPLVKALRGGWRFGKGQDGKVSRLPIKDKHCVPTTTEILTPSGFRRYDDLRPGDACYGYDLQTRRLVRDRVVAVNVYPGAHEVLTWHSRNVRVRVTAEHRMIVAPGEFHHGGPVKWRAAAFRRADTVSSTCGLPSTRALQRGKARRRFSDEFVRLCAWVMTEGHYRRDGSGEIWIMQSEAHGEYFRQLEKLIEAWPFNARTHWDLARPPRPQRRRLYVVLRNELAGLVRVLMPEKYPSPEMIANMRRSEILLFLHEAMKGDGSHRMGALGALATPATPTSFWKALGYAPVLCCGSPGEADAVQHLATLAGIRAQRRLGDRHHRDHRLALLRYRKFGYLGHARRGRQVVETVWCPQTETGTWIMREDGALCPTGNSHPGDAFAYGCAVLFPSYQSLTPPEPPRSRLHLPPPKSFLGV